MKTLRLRSALEPREGTAYTVRRRSGREWMFIVDFLQDGQVFFRRFIRRRGQGIFRGRVRMKLPVWRKSVRQALAEEPAHA